MSGMDAAFRDVTEFTKEPPKWVIRDFIPVGVSILAGPPKKSYKSTITIIEACLAARWACQALPIWMACDLGGPTVIVPYEANGGEILWVLEDGLHIAPEFGSLSIAHTPWEFQLDKPGAMKALLEMLDERDPRLLILDPFRNAWSGDENDSGQVSQLLGPIVRWTHEREAAAIMVHHINKPPTDAQKNANAGGMYSMRGSGAIPGLADGIIVIEPTNEEGVVIINTTFKRGVSWRRVIRLGVPGYGWPEVGVEIMPDNAHAVRELWSKAPPGSRDMDFMATLVTEAKCQNMATVRSMVEMLDRNAVISLTPDERRLFIPHTMVPQ